MLTAEQLQAIKERVNKAFPAPWCTDSKNNILIQNDGRLGKVIRRDDAQFIAHARQDIPALIAEVEYQKANAEQYLKDNVNLHNENLTLNDEVKWLRSESARLRKQLNHTELAEAKARMQAEEMAKVALDDTYNAFMEQREIKRLREALQWYSNPDLYADEDLGVVARKALAGESNE